MNRTDTFIPFRTLINSCLIKANDVGLIEQILNKEKGQLLVSIEDLGEKGFLTGGWKEKIDLIKSIKHKVKQTNLMTKPVTKTQGEDENDSININTFIVNKR